MKQLVADSGYTPLEIGHIDQLEHSVSQASAVVVSTSVSSTVKKDYFEVLETIRQKRPELPIFLATLTEVDPLKKSFQRQFGEKKYVLKSVVEALKDPDPKALIVIRKKDILEPELKHKTVLAMQKHVG